IGEDDLPAVLDEERYAVGRKGDEPGRVVETCDGTIRVNMTRRYNNEVAGMLVRDVEWQGAECPEAQTGKARASLLLDWQVTRRQGRWVGVGALEGLHGGSRRNDFAAIVE